jgi:uncharacterized membrane protein HdeD (DUF308 family)
MSNQTDTNPTSRAWLIFGGLIFILAGIAAMSLPVLATIVIVKVLAYFVLASGIFSLVMAVMGKHKNYRWLEMLSGLIRIAAGVMLLMCLASSAVFITLAFAIYLMVEGLFVAIASLKLRPTPGWVWTLINGIAALVLGILVYLGWPSSSFTVLGVSSASTFSSKARRNWRWAWLPAAMRLPRPESKKSRAGLLSALAESNPKAC